MFSGFEALMALEEYGTMSRAAARLGITQPAITKRIKSLEYELGRSLIEPSGRKVALTPYANTLLARAKPNFLDFKEALSGEASEGTGELVVALSGALLLSWGAKILKRVKEQNPDIIFTFHSHRSPIAVARVRSGECMVALVHGMSELTPDLSARFLIDDTFVVVPSGLEPFKLPRRGKELSLLTIESHSETWSVAERRLRRWADKAGVQLNVANKLQNFMAVTQLSRAGFGNGFTPIGVPLVLGIPKQKLVLFPGEGIKIPVSLVGRRSTLERGIVTRFYESLKENLEKYWVNH